MSRMTANNNDDALVDNGGGVAHVHEVPDAALNENDDAWSSYVQYSDVD